jgi:hypothetical protein
MRMKELVQARLRANALARMLSTDSRQQTRQRARQEAEAQTAAEFPGASRKARRLLARLRVSNGAVQSSAA